MADLGLAYISGIVVGAPAGLLFRAVIGLDAALTTTMLVTMAAVLYWCRKGREYPLPHGFEHWVQSDAGRDTASMTRTRTGPRSETMRSPSSSASAVK